MPQFTPAFARIEERASFGAASPFARIDESASLGAPSHLIPRLAEAAKAAKAALDKLVWAAHGVPH